MKYKIRPRGTSRVGAGGGLRGGRGRNLLSWLYLLRELRLNAFFLFFSLYSCSHLQNLILKLENMVSQLVILEGGGGEKEAAETEWEEPVGGRALFAARPGLPRPDAGRPSVLPPRTPSTFQPNRPS